jgi:diadenylate cyclase
LLPPKHSFDLNFIRKISQAVNTISHKRWGALIVIERTPGLTTDYLESGTRLEALLTPDLLVAIFNPLSPLHDGAIIIQGNWVLAAHCLLPLTDNPTVDKRLGTRHRAALGISEQTDALAITISEQTGIISLVENGQITRYLNKEMLEEKLLDIFSSPPKMKENIDNGK